MELYPALDLDPGAAGALDLLVAGYAAAVTAVLEDAALEEPIASICLCPGQQEGMDALPVIYAGRAADRDRLVRGGVRDWTDAWNPLAFRNEEDAVHPLPEVDGEYAVDRYVELPADVVKAWEVVRDAVEGRCLDPEYWVHARVAHHLNRQPLPVPGTPDLAVWVFSFDAGPGDVLDMLTAVLRPETLAALKASGLIGGDEEAAHRG